MTTDTQQQTAVVEAKDIVAEREEAVEGGIPSDG